MLRISDDLKLNKNFNDSIDDFILAASIKSLKPYKVMDDDLMYSKLLSGDVHFHLEELIAKELSDWVEINSKNNTAVRSDNSHLSEDELKGLLFEIKPVVDNFLDIKCNYCPKIDYHNGYTGFIPTKNITNTVSFVSFIAAFLTPAIYDLMPPQVLDSLTQKIPEIFVYTSTMLLGGYGILSLSNKILRKIPVSTEKKYVYDHLQDKVLCLQDPKNILASSIGHEYDHAISHQIFKKEYLTDKQSFFEGHARGVERFIGQSYAKVMNNRQYESSYNNTAIEEFSQVYYNISQNLNLPTSKVDNLFEIFFGEKANILIADCKESTSLKHAIGHVFFRINEEKHGLNLYAKSLRSGFEF